MPDAKKPVILSPEDDLDEAARVLRDGGVIAYPTETFYGLGVDPFNARAVERLFRLKIRPENKPISIIIKDLAMLKDVAAEVPDEAVKLIERFWPGPLTIVLKALPSIPPALTAYTGKVGVRVSSSPLCGKLLDAAGSPVTATSANPSGEKPPVRATEVVGYFDGDIDLIIDGGELKGRKGSTVIEVAGGGVEILREGEIPEADIKKAILA